jgi:hypothetical protein
MDATAHIHIKTPWLTEQGFVLRCTAMVTVTSGVILGISVRFHHHAHYKLPCLAFHQQATDELGGNHLSRASERALGES